jgi:hypothetical protein
MFDRGNFESYRQQFSLVDWDSLLVSDDIDISTSNITRALIDAANINIPNRVITVRKGSNKGGPTSEYNILWGLFTNTRSNGRTTFSHICRFSD